jgi:methyl-galactoside transport system permease protein
MDNDNNNLLEKKGKFNLKESLNNSFKKILKSLTSFEFYLNNAIYLLIILFILITAIIKPNFLSIRSIFNILNQTALRLPIALGVAGIIVLTGTDLSAGRIVGLVALVVISLLQKSDYVYKMFPNLGNVSILLVLLISLVIGGFFGAFNGIIVSKFKLHPFIVTLATSLIVYACSLIYMYWGENNGMPMSGLREDYSNIIVGSINIGGGIIKVYTFYIIFIIFIMWFIWNKTIIGKNMYAVGCNPDASEVSGISVFKTTLIVFTMAGILYGLSGFFNAADAGSATAATGYNFELDAIAACVIGGISFSGGVGKIRGVVVGVMLLQLITASLIFLGIDPNLQYPIKGIVILVAYILDMRKYVVKK